MRFACLFILGLGGVAALAESDPVLVERILIRSDGLFEDRGFPYGLMNSLHVKTKQSTIMNEMWFEEGELLSDYDRLLYEKSLIDTGLFSDVTAGLDEGLFEVTVEDTMSAVVDPSGKWVGGRGGYGLKLAEKNLFGLGDRIEFEFGSQESEAYVGVSYFDRHFYSKDYNLRLDLKDTDDGEEIDIDIGKRRLRPSESWEWSAQIGRNKDAIDQYLDGDLAGEIPREVKLLRVGWNRSIGIEKENWNIGGDVMFSQNRFEGVEGFDFDDLAFSLSAKAILGAELVEFEYLDSIGFKQIEKLGFFPELKVGTAIKRESSRDDRLEPFGVLILPWKFRLDESLLFTLGASFGGRLSEGFRDEVAREETYFLRSFIWRKNGGSLAFGFEHAVDRDTLGPGVPLYLGENNGLRGYRSRRLQGEWRTRGNLEYRFAPTASLLQTDIGFVVFADAGRVGGAGANTRSWESSIGMGVRFGSKKWLGKDVIRIDLARPLGKIGRIDNEFTLSVSTGQVFRFNGYYDELDVD